MKTILFVTGMHRSGTSAITGLFNLLGGFSGRELLPPAYDNMKGFFEDKAIVKINQIILKKNYTNWDSFDCLPDSWEKDNKFLPIKKRIKKTLKDYLKNNAFIVLKDPRFSLTVPLWLDVLKEMKVEPKFIICLRHPQDIANSLKKRNKFPENKTFLLWKVYLLSIEKSTRAYKRFFALFENLVTSPTKVLYDCSLYLDLNLELKIKNNKIEIENFMDFSMSSSSPLKRNLSVIFAQYDFLYIKLIALKKVDLNNDIIIYLDELWEKTECEYHLLIKHIYSQIKYFSELSLIDKNQNIIKSYKKDIVKGNMIIKFDVSKDSFESIKFRPANGNSFVRINNICIVNEKEKSTFLILQKEDCLLQHLNTYIFSGTNRIEYNFPNVRDIKSVIFNLEYGLAPY